MKQKEYVELLERKLFLRQNVPFLPGAGHKLYPWQEEFIESKNKLNFLTASNQSGKSTSQIIKCLRWAYTPELWPMLWPHKRPNLFWYFYPTIGTATLEFETKWLPIYMPKECMKDDPRYGYRIEHGKKGEIHYIRTNTGIIIMFRSYEIQPRNLQAATVDAIFADEECPIDHYSELKARTLASRGYFHNVFTATLGQEYLRRTMEEQGTELEMFPGAFKKQISMFDCLTYSDGSPSTIWTVERIQEEIKACSSETEVQRRIYGKFVKTEGLRFGQFDYQRNVRKYHEIPKTWNYYAGIDWGSSGEKGHKSSIVVAAVSPDYRKCRIVKSWRSGDEKTTQGDVIEKFTEITKGMVIVEARYDWAAADLGEIAGRHGISFLKANKDHNSGIPLVNLLFQNAQLIIYADEGTDNHLLIAECQTVKDTITKKAVGDDLCDALRYCLASIPFKIESLSSSEPEEKDTKQQHPANMCERMRYYKGLDDDYQPISNSIDDQLSEALELFNDGY